MKQFINYYYGIKIIEYHEKNDIYIIDTEDGNLWFVPFYGKIKKDNLFMTLDQAANYNKIILTLNGDFFVTYNNKNYFLFKPVVDYEKEITVFDMINNNIKISQSKINYKINNLLLLWHKNIDYFIEKYKMLAPKKALLMNSFSYYNGLAEIACQYLSESVQKLDVNEKLDVITICRRKIYYLNYAINYFNPINLIIDFEVRDYAEYFKSYFFSDYDKDELFKEFKSLLKIKKFGVYSYHLFFARLLFPNYYFILLDVENYIDNENKLSKILELNEEWQQFLKNVFAELNNYCEMIKIDWI